MMFATTSVQDVVVSLLFRLGKTSTAAGRRQETVTVVADGRHAGQTADALLTWTEQAPDVVEVLVMMTYDKKKMTMMTIIMSVDGMNLQSTCYRKQVVKNSTVSTPSRVQGPPNYFTIF